MTGEGAMAVMVAIGAALAWVSMGVHFVSEGHIAVYWWTGRLMDDIGEPGMHFMIPIVSRYEEVQVTMQTDRVNNIPCGTAGGVMIEFSSIEVVNRLNKDRALEIIRQYGVNYDKMWIFDKIHHEINQFCSSHTLQEVYVEKFSSLDESLAVALQGDINKHARGIDIIAVRVTKPTIPDQILREFVAMESEKAKLLVAIQHSKVERQVAETSKMKAEILAQQAAAVSLIDKESLIKQKETEQLIERQMSETAKMKAEIRAQQAAAVSLIEKESMLKQKEAEKKIKELEDESYVHRRRAEADAALYSAQRTAQGNALLMTPEFIQLQYARALAANTKIYFGEKIPSMFVGNIPQLQNEFVDNSQKLQSDVAGIAQASDSTRIDVDSNGVETSEASDVTGGKGLCVDEFASDRTSNCNGSD